MSVLKSLESKIAGLVEGAFGRAFRSEVRPVEIARKLVREMEEHRTVSVSKTYVPNEYSVYLSPPDRERFGDYEEALVGELAGYLLEHARAEKLALLSRPRVEFRTDERLELGEFGIQARLVRPPEDAAAKPEQGEAGHTMIYKAQREPEALNPHVPQHLRRALVLVDGKRMVVTAEGAVLGRSRDCDIVPGGALKDLRGGTAPADDPMEATGMHAASAGLAHGSLDGAEPRLRVEHAAGLRDGDEYDLVDGLTLGRGNAADIRVEDPFASA